MNKFYYTINLGGQLINFSQPHVMGIVNATTDSFYAQSRTPESESVKTRTRQLLDEGATMIDAGACSTRPNSQPVDAATEWKQLNMALHAIREVDAHIPVSIDTFRADVVHRAADSFGSIIVNDISGGMEAEMFPLVAKEGLPYVLTYNKKVENDVVAECLRFFAEKVQQLRDLGQKDIILDPGFGFAKTIDENYRLIAHLSTLRQFELPILVGVSRKRMVYELLQTTPAEALIGTQVLHTLCLEQGAADILRVHDAKAAADTIQIFLKKQQQEFT